ncbi:hypothetical protein ACJMK2_022473 [Sinanodonta woodiana]|uniref:C-type lectin domain-containing protein n=1 Tax=Sinanodonta woodiana TaxID=1069815 RepID=A0ABD3TKH1_SINWO
MMLVFLPHVLITLFICKLCGSQQCIKDGNCYEIVDTLVTWNQAFNMCRTDGGNLVIIESSEEQQFIAGLMQKRIFTAVGLWIGSNKVHPEEDRRWINGEKFSYANWAKGEPNFPPAKENCLEIFTSTKWNDNVCTYHKGYICEKTLNMSSNESEQCIIYQTTGHCYDIVDKKTTWDQAFNICRQDGGMLVIIESSEEQQFIEVQMQRIHFTVDGLWMGSNSLHPEKQRAWINGNRFMYANWAEGEPNNEPLIENCAEINTSDSSWNDCDCTYRRGYICETKSPGKSEQHIWVIGVAVASALVLLVGIVLLCYFIRKRLKSRNKARDEVYQEVQVMEINNIGHAYDQAADIYNNYSTIDGDALSPDETHRKSIY